MPRIAVANELAWPVRRHYDLGDGIDLFAEQQGDWQLEVGPYPDTQIKRGEYFDGIVGRITPEIYAAACELGIPVVNVWINSPVADKVPNVMVDATAAGELAARHLDERGFGNLVHVGWLDRQASELHYKAFAKTADELSAAHERVCVSHEFEVDSGHWDEFVSILEKASTNWSAPLGIGVWSDELGRAVVTALRQLGWAIPGEIAVVSANNDFTHCNIAPGLSSIDLGYKENGYVAAHLLDQLMNGKDAPSEPIFVTPQGLVARQSSEPSSEEKIQVGKALRFAMANRGNQVTAAQVADAAGMSIPALDRGFKSTLGRTVDAQLRQMRTDRLKHLLRTSQDPISEIVLTAGFSSETQAVREFEKQLGMGLEDFRSGSSSK